jgi:hypothetical protein
MSDHDPRDDYDDELARGPLAPEHIVRWPASAMWAFGLLQLIFAQMWVALLATTIVLTNFVDDDKTVSEVWDRFKHTEAFWLTLAGWPVATFCTILVMRGGNDLRRFRRYPWVAAGTVLMMLAVPFFYLAVIQLPLGLWVLYFLLRRDVRARFEAVARGTTLPVLSKAPDG